MSELTENIVIDFYESSIQSLKFTRDNLDVRLGKLSKWLKIENITEHEEEMLREFATECSEELRITRNSLEETKSSYKKVMQERAKIKELKSEKDTYTDPTGN